MRRTFVSIALLPALALGACLFPRGPEGGHQQADDCDYEASMLVGQWITPTGSTTASSSYNLTTYVDGGGIDVYQWSDPYSNTVHYVDWMVTSTQEGACDKILVDVDGSGWLADYSKIWQLDATTLDIEATDGTYYGTRTVYDRWSGGGDGDGDGDGDSPTCTLACDPNDAASCTAGEACLNSEVGYVCLPPDCQSCWDQGLTCSYFTTTCDFEQCE